MPSSGVGGLPFAVDPKLSADQATVFWRANALPTVVPLAPSPTSFTFARAIDFAELGEVKERAGPDGRHVIIRTDSGELRVWVLDEQVEQPLVLALPRPSSVAAMGTDCASEGQSGHITSYTHSTAA
jgi:hypothetical protein